MNTPTLTQQKSPRRGNVVNSELSWKKELHTNVAAFSDPVNCNKAEALSKREVIEFYLGVAGCLFFIVAVALAGGFHA